MITVQVYTNLSNDEVTKTFEKAAGYPKALIPFHVPNNIPSTSTWPVCTRHK
jgi:hypothetical protein